MMVLREINRVNSLSVGIKTPIPPLNGKSLAKVTT